MLFSSKNRDSLLLVLDIQSSLIRSSLVLIKDEKKSKKEAVRKPDVIFTHSLEVPTEERLDSKRLIAATIGTTKIAIDEALKYLSTMRQIPSSEVSGTEIQLPRRITAVHYVLSSPWILSEAKHLSTSFEVEKTVTRDMVMKMVRDEREQMVKKIQDDSQTTVVEEKIFGIELNGYDISEWQGKKAYELGISFVTSISGWKMIGRFKDLCAHIVRSHAVHFHSSLLLQYLGIEEVYPDRETYTIVHVHGEITDIVVVEKRSCIFFGTYPFGTETLLRSFAKESNLDTETASSTLSMHASGDIENGSSKDAESISKAYESWSAKFSSLMDNFSPNTAGKTSFIVSAIERRDDFAKILKQIYPNARVEVVSIDDIASRVGFDAKGERSVTMSLYAAALQKIEQ